MLRIILLAALFLAAGAFCLLFTRTGLSLLSRLLGQANLPSGG